MECFCFCLQKTINLPQKVQVMCSHPTDSNDDIQLAQTAKQPSFCPFVTQYVKRLYGEGMHHFIQHGFFLRG